VQTERAIRPAYRTPRQPTFSPRAGSVDIFSRVAADLGANDNAPVDKQVYVTTNLPKCLSAMRDELSIWRAFLSREIDAIMRDNK
jgi:hypothetical protein